MMLEVEGLINNDVMEECSPDKVPRGQKPIRSRIIFKVKQLESGFLDKLKSRLVARGFSETEGVDYFAQHIYAPVVRFTTLRCLLSVVATFDLECDHEDIRQVFLNAKLEKPIYMYPPPGMELLYPDMKPGTIWH